MYMLIYLTEEGETRIRCGNREMVLTWALGDEPTDELVDLSKFFREAPEETDPMYWAGRKLIIKGEIVVPQPVRINYELP